MHHSAYLVPTVILLHAAAGCQFSASASGEARTGGDVDGSANASGGISDELAAEERAITYRAGKLEYSGVINFEYNKAGLRKDAETNATLGEFLTFLAQHPEVSIEVEGHTDSRGSNEYNRDLSNRRAASVRKWLVQNGVADARVTSVGKGEDAPQVPEPPECNNKVPADTTPCEQAWATNRRVAFSVTAGGETLPEAVSAPVADVDPEPEPEPEATAACPWLWGVHANALGPNAWLGGAGAVQPGVCWLEPSLGLGLGLGTVDAEDPPAGTSGDGTYFSLNLPLRARIWYMDRHSLITDVGLSLTRYFISLDMEDSRSNNGTYSRSDTQLTGNAGIGYGYRPNGTLAGFRFAAVIGGVTHFADLDDSSVDAPAGFVEAPLVQAALDEGSDGITELEPYAELSFGWLF